MSKEKQQKRMPGPGGTGPFGGMKGPAPKAKNLKKTMKNLLKYLAYYKFSIVFVIIFAIGSTIFSILGPKILGNATTEIFNGLLNKISGGSGIDFPKIQRILILLLVLYISFPLFFLSIHLQEMHLFFPLKTTLRNLRL